MLDLAFVRANLPLVEQKLRDRNMDPAAVLGEFAAIDARRREAITQAETLKAQRNTLSADFGKLKRQGSDTSALTAQLSDLKSQSEALEAAAAAADDKLRELMQAVPNLPQDSVPVGRSEHDNRVEKLWGTPPAFDFPALPHWEIGERLGILDFERAAKISGSRFVVHYGQGARLERAIANFMLDLHTSQHGYTEVLPPYMVNSKSLFGTGSLPKFAQDLFHCDDKPYEPGVSGLRPLAHPHRRGPRHQPLPRRDPRRVPAHHQLLRLHSLLPLEAGSYGKDVRGMIRQHQFQKVELVKFTTPDRSNEEHERLTRDAERVLEALGLPYRRMLLCTADMGFSSSKTYDLEVWLPGQQLYREISSCSNFEAFQARRANIRYRPAARRNPSSCTPSTAAASPSDAPTSPSSKTTSSPTAPSASPPPSSPT